jgi:hypothetical protein
MSQEQVTSPLHFESPSRLPSDTTQKKSSNPISQLAQLLTSVYERLESEREEQEQQ